jgi:toxin FitB
LPAELIGRQPAVTFVTEGELTKWAVRRLWGTARQQRMALWLRHIPVLHSTDDIAAVWGEIAASADQQLPSNEDERSARRSLADSETAGQKP